MSATSLCHALLSAAAVGLLLGTLHRAGPRAAGLAAAVPINSVPVLFWLSMERGDRDAASAVLGSLCGTGLTVLLGALFVRLVAAWPIARAAVLAWVAVAALAGLGARMGPAATAALALVALAVGRLALPPVPARAPARAAAAGRRTLGSMLAAGSMSLVVSALAPHAGPQLCGLVAALPVVGMFALHGGHRAGGEPVMRQVLHGYLDGMTAKAAFLGTLAGAWVLGAGPWAWACAAALGAAVLLVQAHASKRLRDLASAGRHAADRAARAARQVSEACSG